jgi:hypothetical protein
MENCRSLVYPLLNLLAYTYRPEGGTILQNL